MTLYDEVKAIIRPGAGGSPGAADTVSAAVSAVDDIEIDL